MMARLVHVLGAAALAAAVGSQRQWLQQRDARPDFATTVFDSGRQRIVGYDGRDGVSRTFEAVAGVWFERPSPTAPPPRALPAVAYDAGRRRVVMYGGRDAARWLGDTWEWDGVDWQRRQPPVAPPAAMVAAAYDPARRRTVLYVSTTPPQTWEWDGAVWTRHPAPTVPDAVATGLAWDARRGRIVMFGFSPSTWEFDGQDWTSIPQVGGPQPRVGPVLTYDSRRQRVLMAGGREASGPGQGTWEWDGAAWSEVSGGAGTPAAPGEHSNLVFDPSRGVAVFLDFEEWRWDGVVWSAAPRPAPLVADLAWDAVRGAVLSHERDRTGHWDGVRWRFLQPSPMPAVEMARLATDTLRSRVVLFGGRGAGGRSDATWEWDGSTWQRRLTLRAPSPRLGMAMAFDAVRGVTVLFGGHDGFAPLDDTWEWDGASWVQSPAFLPPARAAAAMAYDLQRGRVVMFGGLGTAVFADTWEWDGSAWRQVQTPTVPPARFDAAMTFDPNRGRIVLTGGSSGAILADTWEYDGVDWRPAGLPAAPGGAASLTYDLRRGRCVALLRGTTTELATVSLPVARTSGAACAGSRGLPRLTSTAPYLGNPRCELHLSEVQPGAPCVFGLAARRQVLPLGGGCTLYLAEPALLATTTNAAGFAATTFAVPRQRWALGIGLYAQAVVIDPGGSFAGLSLTALRELRVGD